MHLDDTLVALADDTRRRILQRLAGGDARVTEIAAPFDISLNSVSKHIRILERAGLVRRRVERVWAYLTESKKRATWLAAGEFDLRLGGRIELHFDNESLSGEAAPPGAMGAGKHSAEGKITRLEPLRVLAHTWSWDGKVSEVTYELAPRGKHVLLTIHHRLPDQQGIKIAVGGGWAVHTGILADRLNGVKPRPFWS